MENPDGESKNISFSSCDKKERKMFTTSAAYVLDLLVIGREDIESGERFIELFNTKDPFNTINHTCAPISAYRKQAGTTNTIYVDGDNVLKRWVITPDSKQFLSAVIGKTKHVCSFSHYNSYCNRFSQLEMLILMKTILWLLLSQMIMIDMI